MADIIASTLSRLKDKAKEQYMQLKKLHQYS